jgi:hypothetical protein
MLNPTFFSNIGIGIRRRWTTDRKLHVNTLILIPMSKFYMFWYSLQTDRQADKSTDRQRNTLAARGLEELFFSCAVVSVFWFLAGNRFWCYLLMYLEYNTVVALCYFFGSGGK